MALTNVYMLLEHKHELMSRLQSEAEPLFFSGLKSIYDHVKKDYDSRPNVISSRTRSLLQEFQDKLREVSLWDATIINTEYRRFISKFHDFGEKKQCGTSNKYRSNFISSTKRTLFDNNFNRK